MTTQTQLDSSTTEPAPRTARPTARRRRKVSVTKVLIWVALIAATLIFIYPFIWLLSASFKPRGEVFDNRLIPETFTFDNYLNVWQEAPMALWLWAQNLFGSAFYIFLLRQFFLGLPRELFDAAKIDGANNWTIFTRIAMPLCKPALIITLLFEFQAIWTDLMRPLIYLRDSDNFTVPRGLKALLDQYGFGGEWHWEIVVTASVITTVPMIILFFLGQRHFVQGIATTGSKG